MHIANTSAGRLHSGTALRVLELMITLAVFSKILSALLS
jgi:hypothetical protein